ncbi:MAG: succinate dehydrogenase [Simkaniaceae bacterium]|nr:succinate dehydrogenase [Simkaniaceae bacterium]MCF7851786.1 succinate dehydrogenase [Simkaniaceae bacterium]
MTTSSTLISQRYIWARVHSLMGLGIVLFLMEHLITNSQAALMIGQDGAGFIRMVNWLHDVPYLHVVEILLIGIPILFHAGFGVYYAVLGRFNSMRSNGSRPIMQYKRNHAYTWQRLTSWILLIGIALHVFYMRFLIYPIESKDNKQTYYLTRMNMDEGLYSLCDRLNVRLFNISAISNEKNALAAMASKMSLVDQKLQEIKHNKLEADHFSFDPESASIYDSLQRFQEKKEWVRSLEERPIDQYQVIAAANSFGTATLLNVRESFKSPIKSSLYTVFVIAAVFHAFNGFWTFLMTWGAILKMGTQHVFTKIALALMILFGFLGLAAIWGSYWINLRS